MGKLAQKVVESQHIAVEELPVVADFCIGTVQVAEDPVHVPLDVVDVGEVPGFAEGLEQVGAHILAGEVEQVLVASHTWPAAGDGYHPLGVLFVELALDAYHFRFHPESEHHAQAVDFQGKAAKA